MTDRGNVPRRVGGRIISSGEVERSLRCEWEAVAAKNLAETEAHISSSSTVAQQLVGLFDALEDPTVQAVRPQRELAYLALVPSSDFTSEDSKAPESLLGKASAATGPEISEGNDRINEDHNMRVDSPVDCEAAPESIPSSNEEDPETSIGKPTASEPLSVEILPEREEFADQRRDLAGAPHPPLPPRPHMRSISSSLMFGGELPWSCPRSV